jgi:DNA-directed RNA polymerase specialized sigma24 family protein
MRQNKYAGLIEPWKVRLVTNRASRRGYRGADLDEVIQRILIELLDFEFCEQRSNGATEATAITALVDRQLAYYWRGESRYRRHVDAATAKTEPTIDYRDTFDEAMDVRDAIDELPEFTRRVCEALSNGLSISETAKRLGVSWHTVGKQVEFLREHFGRLGFAPADEPKKKEEEAA